MSSKQPVAIGVIGDVNYLDYGGMVVYEDGYADYIVPDEDDEDAPVVIYTLVLGQVDDAEIRTRKFDLAAFARFTGRPKAEIASDWDSTNKLVRAGVYYDLIHYLGPSNFDESPVTLTKSQAEKRYERVDKELGELKPNPLLSARDTAKVEKLVRRAAAVKFGRGKARPFFEHGQWFVEVGNRMYSVADYRPGLDGTGLDFEELG
jgi:hypothetical protein